MNIVEKRRKFLIGKEFETNNCGKCVITEYISAKQLTVMFYDPLCYVKCSFCSLERGNVSNPLYPTAYGKGFLGYRKGEPIDKRAYSLWIDMLARCYDKVVKKNSPTYEGVEVCKEWLCFKTFSEWCENNAFFKAKDTRDKSYHLDKDILVRGNKIYSPDTCCFVPHRINTLLLSSKGNRGEYPLGVTWSKTNKKFTCRVKTGNSKAKYLGYFNSSEDAFLAYKKAKESLIKDVACEWKGRISDDVYQALLNYEIKITD